ncbi:diguanylate cyclase [Paraglaciecola polaris]|uniref:GGDEF domain-containing protein n=1 Tax=Paraglaciecola polaris TaxID=222814 RepID=UPI0030EB9E61
MLKFWFKEFPQYPADHIDYWRTRLIAHALLITTCYFLILTVINIVTFNDHHLALLDGVGLLVSLGIFVWFRGTGKVDSASWALTILVTALILLFVVTAGGYSHSLFWASLIPPFAFFLIGRTWGTVISVCAFVVCAVLVFLQVEAQQSVTFNTGSLLNVIEVCIAHILLFRFYERTRSSAYQQLAIRNAEIIKMAEIDKLTGLFNRDKLDTVLAECMQSLTDDSALSVMIIDIDHFKSINDQYGHLEGGSSVKRPRCAIEAGDT